MAISVIETVSPDGPGVGTLPDLDCPTDHDRTKHKKQEFVCRFVARYRLDLGPHPVAEREDAALAVGWMKDFGQVSMVAPAEKPAPLLPLSFQKYRLMLATRRSALMRARPIFDRRFQPVLPTHREAVAMELTLDKGERVDLYRVSNGDVLDAGKAVELIIMDAEALCHAATAGTEPGTEEVQQALPRLIEPPGCSGWLQLNFC